MEIDHAPPTNEAVTYVDTTGLEAFDRGVWLSKNLLPVTPDFPPTSLYTTQTSHKYIVSKDINTSRSKQPSAMVIERTTSQPDPPKAKIACLRCRSKKSRCSGQRPCGGCSKDGLDCIWDDDKARQKRDSRENSTKGKRKAAKGRISPLQVRNACTRCQYRKAKCTGTRPACTYCVERQLECAYDVAEGETRASDLKRRLRDSEIKVYAFGRILAVIREGNIYQATEVLARLRIGETPRDILQSLPTSIASASPNSESVQSELHQRLST
jgi:hypothetical protein